MITVIARNTQRGQILEISRGDLIKLVQDERIQLAQAMLLPTLVSS